MALVELSDNARKLQAWPCPNNTRCCACWKDVPIKGWAGVFCATCHRALSDERRRLLQNTPREVSHGIIKMCLQELGLDPESRMLRIPQATHAVKTREDHCKCSKPYTFRQKNLLTGGEDVICDKCGRSQR